MMKAALFLSLALAAGTITSSAHAQVLTQPESAQLPRATVRIPTQGLGYSVLHEGGGIPSRPHRVHVTCRVDESFARTYCPSPRYDAYCPNATIVCR
ncbi:hypothetical protein ACFOYU_05455 [Microvirga sp. GCM10011540]|uniref:hypothetical protein n=1 Tax=Microvirga sp. GCM10011540 TaxID=3317338 RepID=UPI003618B8FF